MDSICQSPKRVLGPYPVIASTGQVGTHHAAAVNGPGVVIGRSGSLGGGQFVRSDFWPLNTTLWVKDFQGNDRRFCYYFLKSLDLSLFNAGSGVPTLNRNHIHPLPVKIPSVITQRAIAHVLGTLDDKIELTQRMNETLEEMARALFKSWFVNFDPVRAKMEGRWPRGESLPGLPPDLYDLFPNRLIPSELGEIPEGWEVKPLDEIATFLNGLALQKYPANGGPTLPVIKDCPVCERGHALGADAASSSIPSKYIVHDGDVSVSLGRAVWNFRCGAGGPGALNQHLFKVSSDSYPKWLYYHWVREHLPEFRGIAADKTTTMGHIQRRHLRKALAVVPDFPLLDRMSCHLQLLLERSIALRLESRGLATQRNVLLPKLVSGEVRVRDFGAFYQLRKHCEPSLPVGLGPIRVDSFMGRVHLRGANDFDRRIALISFDNAIEVAIATYLTLKPIQRGDRSYEVRDVVQWTRNYHTKLDFLEEELKSRKITWMVEKDSYSLGT